MLEVKKSEKRIYKFPNYPECIVDFYQHVDINNEETLISGVGSTKCDKGDKYDKKFGLELAGVRAEINMLKQYEGILIGLTKQPEWRKELPKKEKPKYEVIIEPDSTYWGFNREHVNIFNNNIDKKVKVTIEVL